MDPVSATAQPASPVPATVSIGETSSISAYREARDKGATEIPNPAAPADAPVVPDPDVEADPELRKAVDELEAPAPEETPQQKAARTKRHKEAAIKRRVTNLAKARDSEKARADAAERERDDLRRRVSEPAAPQRQTPPAYDGSDPNDPRPTEDQFASDPDPWKAHTIAEAAWTARKEMRKAQHADRQSSMAAQADERRVSALRAFDTHANELRKTEPDFDAAIQHLDLTGPMQAVIFNAGDLGPSLALALARDPALHARLLHAPPAVQFLELGALKTTVAAKAVKAAAPAPIPVTAAPDPHTPVGGAGSASTPNPKDIQDVATYRANRDRLIGVGS